MTKLQLSIIIVSYNTKKMTLDTIKSIYRHSHDINLEIIVVDNISKDGSVEALKKLASKKKNLHFIEEKKNWGFGIANNIGAKKAKGEYLLFLNSDTLVHPDVLPYSLSWFTSHPKTGVYSCRLEYKDKTTQASGGYFPTLGRLFAWQFFLDDLPLVRRLVKSVHPYIKHPLYSRLTNLDWVTGAFMMIPKKIFDQVKGFDKKIWLYVEELELCYRINQAGYQVVYDPTHSITHLAGGSGTSFIAITNEIKNTIYFFSKHKPKWQLPLVRLIFIFGSLFRFIIFGIIGHNEKARQSYWQGLKIAA